MPTRPPHPTPIEPPLHTVAWAGAVALAVAMGIGRFAFTPLLPMMLADSVIDLHGASWLASMNYLGYLVGALLCTFQPWIWQRLPGLPPVNGPAMVRLGLLATGALTLGMALPWPPLWPALRFAAGLASALVFVFSSGWCLATLARRGAPAMGALMFTGPGAGIVVSGLLASVMVAWHWRAATAWLIMGVLAWLLSGLVWRVFGRGDLKTAPTRAVPTRAAPRTTSPPDISLSADAVRSPAAVAADADAAASAAPSSPQAAAATAGTATIEIGAPIQSRAELAWLSLAYGLAGLGYIVTATFLPVIARSALPGSVWLDLFWPLFGAGVIVGAAISSRLRFSGDLRWLLAGAYVLQALGVAIGLWWPSLAGFALGSLLLGLPFTAITFFAMQEVRRLRPHNVAGTTGLLTAVYGLGQIVGPPLVAWLVQRSGSEGRGFDLSLMLAAAALMLGAVLYLVLIRQHPVKMPRPT